jgi:dCMP deaminase
MIMETKRPSKEEYYLNIAREVLERSTCTRSKFGAVLVKDDQIISTGYNGAPRKTMDCMERGNCLRKELNIPSGHRYELCRSVHAEQNAVINAARSGVSLLGADLFLLGKKVADGENEYIKALPCFICKKMVINAGIKKVITQDENGKVAIFDVIKWAQEWKEKDMLDDIEIYDAKYKAKK